MKPTNRLLGGRTRGFWIWRVVAGALAALATLIGSQHMLASQPAALRAEALGRAEALYAKNCQVCHGARMEGAPYGGANAPPPLVKPGFQVFFWLLPSAMEGWVGEQIANGGNGMPPFTSLISGPDRAALAELIHVRN